MAAPDPKSFYNTVMPGKQGYDYEYARWHATPLLEAQYAMTRETIERRVIPLARQAHAILEVGPGAGTWTKMLATAAPSARLTVLDISSEMLSRARAVLGLTADNVTFIEHDFVSHAGEEAYDFFFSSRAIEYMPDKAGLATSIARHLRSGAKGALITKMPKPLFNALRGRRLSALHGSQISPRELKYVLTAAGLTVNRIDIATATVPGLGNPWLNRVAHALLLRVPFGLSLFAESYLVTFTKP